MKQYFVVVQVEETIAVTANSPEEAATLAETYQGDVVDSAIIKVLEVVDS